MAVACRGLAGIQDLPANAGSGHDHPRPYARPHSTSS